MPPTRPPPRLTESPLTARRIAHRVARRAGNGRNGDRTAWRAAGRGDPVTVLLGVPGWLQSQRMWEQRRPAEEPKGADLA